MYEFREGDVGNILEVEVTEVDDVTGGEKSVDLSGVTTKEIKLKKPSGDVLTVVADFTTDGADGLLRHAWASGELSEPSANVLWIGVAHVAWPAGMDLHGEPFQFKVRSIFDV